MPNVLVDIHTACASCFFKLKSHLIIKAVFTARKGHSSCGHLEEWLPAPERPDLSLTLPVKYPSRYRFETSWVLREEKKKREGGACFITDHHLALWEVRVWKRCPNLRQVKTCLISLIQPQLTQYCLAWPTWTRSYSRTALENPCPAPGPGPHPESKPRGHEPQARTLDPPPPILRPLSRASRSTQGGQQHHRRRPRTQWKPRLQPRPSSAPGGRSGRPTVGGAGSSGYPPWAV